MLPYANHDLSKMVEPSVDSGSDMGMPQTQPPSKHGTRFVGTTACGETSRSRQVAGQSQLAAWAFAAACGKGATCGEFS